MDKKDKVPVLMIADNFPPVNGGISRITENFYKYSQSIKLFVLTMFNENRDIKSLINVAQFPLKKRGGVIKNFRFLIYALNIAHRNRVKAIICSHFREGYIGIILKWILRIPIVVLVYGGEILESFEQHPFWSKLLLRNVDLFVACSSFTKQLLSKYGMDKNKIKVILPGTDVINDKYKKFDPSLVRKKYGLKNKKIILTVARLAPLKGIDTVIKAVHKISLKVDNIVYLVVGKGPDETRLKKLVKELKMEDKVIFCGFIPQEKLFAYYKACDVFVMISRPEIKIHGEKGIEGFGISFIEAGAAGKPVIGGHSGGIPDAVIHGKTGLLVDPLSVDKVAKALLLLLNNPSIAKKMGENGKKRAQGMSWPLYVEKLEKLILELIS